MNSVLAAALGIIVKELARFEGCKLVSYKDIVGVWTIGYGETLGIVEGMVWSQQQADEELRRRAVEFMLAVAEYAPNLRNEDARRLAACTLLAYNIGKRGFKLSSVCRHAKAGNWQKAGESFLLWDKAGGKKVRGLAIRRSLESSLFLLLRVVQV